MIQAVTGIALFRALRHRAFALLWTGQALSRIGDFLYEIALAWWVLQKTGSALAMGTVLICAMTPMLLFLLIGGVAVDRLPRIPVMLLSDVARGVVVGTVALLAFTDALQIWEIYLASLVFGFVDAFFQPAYVATVPDLTPEDDWPSANSLTSLSVQLGRVAGPAIGAALVAWGGSATAFALNALSFFVSAALLVPLLGRPAPAPAAQQEEHGRSSMLGEVRAGLSTVLGSPWLWVTITVSALGNVLLAGPYSVAMPFLVKDFLHANVDTLGLIYAIFPIGYILGSLWLGRLRRIRHRGWLAYGGTLAAGLGLALFGLPLPIVVLLAAALFNGAGLEVFGLIWTNTMQELVPRDRLGRVASIDMLGSYVLLPIGFAVTGWATQQFGPAPVFILGGAGEVVLVLLALLHPRIRGLD